VRMASATAAMIPFFTCHTGRGALGMATFSAEEIGDRPERGQAAALPFQGFERPEDDDEPAPSEREAGAAERGDGGTGEEATEAKGEGDTEAEGVEGEAKAGAADAAEAAAAAGAGAAGLLRGLQTDAVVSLWLPDADAFSRLLARNPNWVHPSGMHPMMKLGSSLVASADNPAIALRHLLAAVREVPMTEGEAARQYPAQAVAAALEQTDAEQRPSLRTRLRLSEQGAVEPVTELCCEAETSIEGSTEVASENTAELVNRSGGERVLSTDRVRLLCAAYPGRVLVRGGRRYRVLLPEEQGRIDEGVAWAEPERRRIQTSRIRTLSVDFEGQGDELRLGGGATVRFHHPGVSLTETVLGLRQIHEARRFGDSIVYREPIEANYPTQAAVLHLPSTTEGALEALEMLVRTTLPAFVYHGEDDLDVACNHGDEPALVIVDRHPGGVGFARAVTSAVLRHALYWAREIVSRCGESEPCARDDGCRECIWGAPRLSPDGQPRPSRTEVAALLGELLGDEGT